MPAECGGRTFPLPSLPAEGAGKAARVFSGSHPSANHKEQLHARHHDDRAGHPQWRRVGVEIDRKDQRKVNGATIQEHACPRCAIRRTVRIASASFCFNCGLHWGEVLSATAEPRLAPAYTFTAAETARLTIYRSAIHAGFYSDQFEPAWRSSLTTKSNRDACSLMGTVAVRQRTSFANASVSEAQLSEWRAPERR
jgi:hypothetical protein